MGTIEEIYKNSNVEDRPDERDYKHEELFGYNEGRPTEYYSKLSEVLDQGKTMRCTLYSMEWAMVEQNAIEANDEWEPDKYEKANPDRFLREAKRKGFSEKNGWYIQAPLDLYKQMGKISGYWVVKKDIDSICSAILSHWAVLSGSSTIDWTLTGIDWIAKLWNWGWHAFWICGYNTIRKQFLIRNSWWVNWWPFNGYFWLDFGMIDSLFTCYVPYDKSDAPELYAYKAIKKGITTQTFEQFRANDLCTRQEAALFISRAFKVEQNIIWNTMAPNNPITSYECEVMIARARGLQEPSRNWEESTLKRWEVVKNITTIL